MRACSGVWIAHGSGSADKQTVDRHSRVAVPPGEESYLIRRVWLSPEEEKGYYYGFSNEGLWPLCHIAHARPIFRSEDWKHYQAVNQRFADAVCEEVDSEDPIVLVQDYHFALAPRLIRERLPRATVIMFWHIPWPNSARLGICPWRNELLEGMLGASILGFHTQFDCNNFVESVDRFLEARIDREQTRSRAARSYDARAALSDLAGVAGALVGHHATGGRVPACALRGTEPARRRPDRRGRRPPRLHEGRRGAAPGRGAPARALSGVPRAVHVRPARSPQPNRDRALPAVQRERRAAGRAHQRALRRGRLPPHRPAAARTTSRPPSSATTAPPTSAT